MTVSPYILTAAVTVPVAADGEGWTAPYPALFPKGQPIGLDPDGELYAAITAVNADALVPLTAVQETGGQNGTSNLRPGRSFPRTHSPAAARVFSCPNTEGR